MPDVPVEITAADRDNLDLWRRRDSLTPAEATTLKEWRDPVLAAAITVLSQ
jgi:hypothetical protein